jgi:hypothetical protein
MNTLSDIGNGKTSTGRTITHLNFAIPLEALTDTVNAYLKDENRNWLDKLNMPLPRIGDIWSLRGTAPVWDPIEKGTVSFSCLADMLQTCAHFLRGHLMIFDLCFSVFKYSPQQVVKGIAIRRNRNPTHRQFQNIEKIERKRERGLSLETLCSVKCWF